MNYKAIVVTKDPEIVEHLQTSLGLDYLVICSLSSEKNIDVIKL